MTHHETSVSVVQGIAVSGAVSVVRGVQGIAVSGAVSVVRVVQGIAHFTMIPYLLRCRMFQSRTTCV